MPAVQLLLRTSSYPSCSCRCAARVDETHERGSVVCSPGQHTSASSDSAYAHPWSPLLHQRMTHLDSDREVLSLAP